MLNDNFHAWNDNSCKWLYGFRKWKEAKIYVQMMMPEIKIKTSRAISYDIKANKITFEPFTEFEQLMIAKMFFTTALLFRKFYHLAIQSHKEQE